MLGASLCSDSVSVQGLILCLDMINYLLIFLAFISFFAFWHFAFYWKLVFFMFNFFVSYQTAVDWLRIKECTTCRLRFSSNEHFIHICIFMHKYAYAYVYLCTNVSPPVAILALQYSLMADKYTTLCKLDLFFKFLSELTTRIFTMMVLSVLFQSLIIVRG